ncbi:MAG: hypothetical protein QXR19_11215 [Candidatus Jordarchaeaceae archaeon]
MSAANFSDKIEKLIGAERISKNDIQILGGEIEENDLQRFIEKWDFSNMPFTILETLSGIIIEKKFDLSHISSNQIERIRIFGQDGDLDIRRDANHFLWRYIGRKNPPKDINAKDFWNENPHKKFFVEEKEALLWGRKYDPNRNLWKDDRVAKAKLSYPGKGSSDFPKVRYKALSEKGVVSFVWFLEVRG